MEKQFESSYDSSYLFNRRAEAPFTAEVRVGACVWAMSEAQPKVDAHVQVPDYV